MHGKRDLLALVALGIGGLLASSLTEAGVLLGLPLIVLGASVLTVSTAWRIRRAPLARNQ